MSKARSLGDQGKKFSCPSFRRLRLEVQVSMESSLGVQGKKFRCRRLKFKLLYFMEYPHYMS